MLNGSWRRANRAGDRESSVAYSSALVAKRRYGELPGALEGTRRERPGAARAILLLRALAELPPRDAEELARLHDTLLFLRAYPHSPEVFRRAGELLERLPGRVAELAATGADLTPLDEMDVSGIAGTAVTMAFSYDYLRWLTARYQGRLSIAWDTWEGADRLGAFAPRFLPLLEEEALADANVSFREWLDAARGRRGDLAWLLDRVDRLRKTAEEKAELWDALALEVRWELGGSDASRTRARRPVRRPFVWDAPLYARRDVSLTRELEGPALPVRTLPPREGARALDLARGTMGVRYRELYAFTYGDPGTVVSAQAGRGVELLLFGLVRDRRLPLRAGYGLLLVKNGVPVGYGDAYALCERLDISFNVFPAFRDGESAWLYARLLAFCTQHLGVTSFWVDPYQIGLGNDEALDSGAFWFYRKLGFSCSDAALEALARREEARLVASPGQRTSHRTLQRLAEGHVTFALPGSDPSAWAGFSVRRVGMAVQRWMARRSLEADGARGRAAERLAHALELGEASSTGRLAGPLESLGLVLAAGADLRQWSPPERRALAEVVRAKASRSETRYLHLTQRHPRLRASLLALGSRG